MKFRIGIGYDLHRLGPSTSLILGGVEIAHEKGLIGHSDGDVLSHAITDALLGDPRLLLDSGISHCRRPVLAFVLPIRPRRRQASCLSSFAFFLGLASIAWASEIAWL